MFHCKFNCYRVIKIGLQKININEEKINHDNNNNLSVLTEGYQTLLRKIGALKLIAKEELHIQIHVL